MQVSIPIDCRQCVNFVWRRNSCGCIYTCVNGGQYKLINPIQIFMENDMQKYEPPSKEEPRQHISILVGKGMIK